MINKKGNLIQRCKHYLLICIGLILVLSILVGCGPSTQELAAVDYAPLPGDDWQVSTPAEQGLDPELVAQLYYNASRLETIYSLLLFKNGYLIAEDYFHTGSAEQQVNIQSVTKSITSALVGIALDQGCLTSLDQVMTEFFPEFESQITDPRKRQITLRQMLQMRAGYPWEESHPALWEGLLSGHFLPLIKEFPLTTDPGTEFQYSNLTSYLLGVIVARSCEMDLKTFAQEHLFSPLGIEPGFWQQDWDGYYLGFADLNLTAHDMAKVGLMYLNDGVYADRQIVPADWVHDSLQIYSENAWKISVGRNWRDNGYGYQWWSVRTGNHRYSLAWGHGGQQIALLDELDMLIVVIADPLHKQHGDEPWKYEKANLNLVADFVASIPGE